MSFSQEALEEALILLCNVVLVIKEHMYTEDGLKILNDTATKLAEFSDDSLLSVMHSVLIDDMSNDERLFRITALSMALATQEDHKEWFNKQMEGE